MTRWIGLGSMVQWILIFSLVAVTAQALTPVPNMTSPAGQKLILNIYTDKTGKALVTGYIEDIHSLPFLNTSQYKYDNDTRQLYALTDSLTRKDGDLWTLNFTSQGYFDDYHVTFFLPSDIKLQKINSSTGLEYLLSASNQSLEADIQGYEVHNPAVAIAYQQPLQETQSGSSGSNPSSLYPIVVIALLLAIGSASFIITRRRRAALQPSPAAPVTAQEVSEPMMTKQNAVESPEEALLEAEPQEKEPVAGVEEDALAQSAEPDSLDISANGHQEDAEKPAKIQVSSEMTAVLQTLTPRERAIMEALIEHTGRMTQADLRYETQTPKSSLSGILLSLERRKLITKKEWGRTNVIELSEWFLS